MNKLGLALNPVNSKMQMLTAGITKSNVNPLSLMLYFSLRS